MALQLPGVAPAHPPEVRDGPVIPQKLPVAQLVKLRDPHPVFVRGKVLGHNVHGHLAQVEVGADPGGGGDPGALQHIQNHLHSQLPGGEPIELQVVGGVDEYLVDGVHMNVLGGNVFEVHLVDGSAGLHIQRHLGRGHQVIHLQLRMPLEGGQIHGFPREFLPRGRKLSDGVDLLHPLNHLKQPGSARNPEALQGGGHRQADGFFRPALVRHHQVGGHGVLPPEDALHGGVEGFEINGNKARRFHFPASILKQLF